MAGNTLSEQSESKGYLASLHPDRLVLRALIIVNLIVRKPQRLFICKLLLGFRCVNKIIDGALVAAPHIDTITDSRGNLIEGAGLETIAKAARGNSGLLRTAILIDSEDGAQKARALLDKAGLNEQKVAIIDISERSRGGGTITGRIVSYFRSEGVNVRPNSIGIGMINSEINRNTIRKEIEAIGRESASIVLVGEGVKESAQTVYADVMSAVQAAAVKHAGFVALGISEDSIQDFASYIKRILGSAFVRFIVNITKGLEEWINSVDVVSRSV